MRSRNYHLFSPTTSPNPDIDPFVFCKAYQVLSAAVLFIIVIMGSASSPFHVLIIGAGLGGLSCAISCLLEGLDVTILERSPVLGEV